MYSNNLKNIKILAITSGKGGVGKTTVATNLAFTLKKLGKKVGILDADIYGPNQMQLFDINKKNIQVSLSNKMNPIEKYGIYIMSIGLFMKTNNPIIWRGPMINQALKQMLYHTDWKDIDFLIIDFPPGTGDTQITLLQNIKNIFNIVVTTPQDTAISDSEKSILMSKKFNIPILGIIENMSYIICHCCNTKISIFGKENKIYYFAKKNNIKYLGNIPIVKRINLLSENINKSIIDYESIYKYYINISHNLIYNMKEYHKLQEEK